MNIAFFGIIAVSLDVGIVNVFVYRAIGVRLFADFNTHVFGDCANF